MKYRLKSGFEINGGLVAAQALVDVVLSGFVSSKKNSTIEINLRNSPLSLSNLVVTWGSRNIRGLQPGAL